MEALYVITLGKMRCSGICTDRCNASRNCLPFSHALLALYVITLGEMRRNGNSVSKCDVSRHCWPFSQALMEALYVITLN